MPSSAAFRGVVFDLDGTLVDSYAAITESLNHALAAAGHPPLPPAEVRGLVGHGLEALVEKVLGAEGVDEGVRRFRERYAEVYLETTCCLPDVKETVAALAQRGYRMGVASNKPARFGRPLLEHLGLGVHFQGILGPDLVEHTKPHPAMMCRLLEILELPGDEVVYVGDMPVDVETCRNAGLCCWLVPTGSSPVEELVSAGGDRLLDGFSELLDLLGPAFQPGV